MVNELVLLQLWELPLLLLQRMALAGKGSGTCERRLL